MLGFQGRGSTLGFSFIFRYLLFQLVPSCVLRKLDPPVPNPLGLCSSSSSWIRGINLTVICVLGVLNALAWFEAFSSDSRLGLIFMFDFRLCIVGPFGIADLKGSSVE